MIFDLPATLDSIQIKILSELINQPYLQDYIEQNSIKLLFYMLINDKDALSAMQAAIVSDPAALCAGLDSLRLSSGVKPLSVYTNSGGSCVLANPEGADTGSYFANSNCTVPIDFQPSSLNTWCAEMGNAVAGNKQLLGNAAAWGANASPEPVPGFRSKKWTIAQNTQLPLDSEPIAGNTTPFMKRIDYRDITWKTPAVSCKLEMRIYKKDVNATNLTPLMAIHGGSWNLRGAGFIPMEAEISHYTDQGFVVFAPFYRLASNTVNSGTEGNPECQDAAWSDITTDVEAALTWVQQNGAAFGAKPGKISIMGQSAGAHLAGWLVTHRPNDVQRALLLYPPADVRDFITHAKVGDTYAAYTSSLNLLATYYGVTTAALQSVDVNNPPPYVAQNSFRDLVAAAPTQMPPVFLIHGRADTLIPSNQSVLLCNAYGGNAVDNGGGTALRATYNCGPNGRLHLFEEANHALDLCITTRINKVCKAGSEASRKLVASSLRQARGWLQGNEFPWLVPVMNLLLE